MFHWGGSAVNGATPSSYIYLETQDQKYKKIKKYILYDFVVFENMKNLDIQSMLAMSWPAVK